MNSILEEFAYGNVSPENQSFDKSSKYGRAVELLAHTEQKMLDMLKGDNKELLEKYIDAQSEVNSLIAVKNLIYGYRLGLIMTAEAFIGMDDLYLGGEDL